MVLKQTFHFHHMINVSSSEICCFKRHLILPNIKPKNNEDIWTVFLFVPYSRTLFWKDTKNWISRLNFFWFWNKHFTFIKWLMFQAQKFAAWKDVFLQIENKIFIKLFTLSPCLFHIPELSLEKTLKLNFETKLFLWFWNKHFTFIKWLMFQAKPLSVSKGDIFLQT